MSQCRISGIKKISLVPHVRRPSAMLNFKNFHIWSRDSSSTKFHQNRISYRLYIAIQTTGKIRNVSTSDHLQAKCCIPWSTCAGALPWTSMGKLTALPQTLNCPQAKKARTPMPASVLRALSWLPTKCKS